MWIVLGVLVFGVISFVAGAQYGREAEAKLIAFGLKIDAESGEAEFKVVVDKILSSVYADYKRISRYL